jgi:hypothetical protein
MRKGCVAFIALTLIGLGVASCGRFQREQRAAWRDEAENACLARGEVRANAYVSFRDQPINGPGTCGMQRPVRVNAFAGGQIALTSTQTLACPIVPVTDRFLAEVVQPAAMGTLGAQVIEMRAGSYSCRAMNNGTGTTRRSEHAFGNALDIFSFRLSDGREVTVRHGWNGSPEEQAFLREVFVGACGLYRTVLGPGADMFHYDHFHVDLARHNGGRSICRPTIKFTPRRDLPPRDPAGSPMAAAPLPPRGPMVATGPIPATPRSGQPQPLTPQPLGPPIGFGQQPLREPGIAVARAPAGPALSPPSLGGPIRLPGSVIGPEEVVLGDIEGEMIDPDADPFADARESVRQPAMTPRPVPAPQPAPLPAPAGRPWPPRF